MDKTVTYLRKPYGVQVRKKITSRALLKTVAGNALTKCERKRYEKQLKYINSPYM
jgi:hypothetical protein